MSKANARLNHLRELTKNLCGTRVCKYCGKECSEFWQDEELTETSDENVIIKEQILIKNGE